MVHIMWNINPSKSKSNVNLFRLYVTAADHLLPLAFIGSPGSRTASSCNKLISILFSHRSRGASKLKSHDCTARPTAGTISTVNNTRAACKFFRLIKISNLLKIIKLKKRSDEQDSPKVLTLIVMRSRRVSNAAKRSKARMQ